MKTKFSNILLIIICSINIYSQNIENNSISNFINIRVGAERTNYYLNWVKGKNVAIVANQTSTIGKTHIVDTLLSLKVNIVKIFCPEHGFRGEAEAGAYIYSDIDYRTGIPIISLFGSTKKPSLNSLDDVDIVVFDIQDVGARFYTYISTLHYVMEACAEKNKQLLVFDRPNPNGYFIDGPVLKRNFKSFVGMHPVPISHGMTIGEYAKMINGEMWLCDSIKCNLTIIPVLNYTHFYRYKLPIAPSPNLQTMQAIYLYPSLCLFEGTAMSIGRGTNKPFEVLGHPTLPIGNFTFIPMSIHGKSENPIYKDKVNTGFDLSEYANVFLKENNEINLFWIIDMYNNFENKNEFFNNFFDKLAGDSLLRYQIINGMTENQIKNSWKPEIAKFKQIRKKYLLYPDFE